MVTLNEAKELVKKFDYERNFHVVNPTQTLTHIIEELGELARHFLFLEGYKDSNTNRRKPEHTVGSEFADLLILIMSLAYKLNIDLEAEFLQKMRDNEKKIPPEKALDWFDNFEKKAQKRAEAVKQKKIPI